MPNNSLTLTLTLLEIGFGAGGGIDSMLQRFSRV